MSRRRSLFILLACIGLPLVAPAQQKAEERLYIVTYVDVFPEFAADTVSALHEFEADSRKDPGSVRFEVLQDTSRTNHFTIVEAWQSRKAYESHLKLDHSKKFRERLQPHLGSPYDERLYHALP